MYEQASHIPVAAGRSFSALFVPRRPGFGAPVELKSVSAELVRACDFAVVGTLEDGLSLRSSGAPHFEYVVAGDLPVEALPGELYYVRLCGTDGRKTYRAAQALVVKADLAAALQNLTALTVASGGFA